MGPYEIHWPGGSIEHNNREPGSHWLKRILDQYVQAVWLNPVPLPEWKSVNSIRTVKELMDERMYPLTMEGLSEAMHVLN